MANYSATFGNYTHTLTVTETSYSITANTSTVAWAYSIHRNTSAGYGAFGTRTLTGSVAGVPISDSQAFDFRNYADLTVASGSLTVAHNADGSKSISSIATWPYHTAGMPGGTVGGSLTLTKIPRNRVRVGVEDEWETAEVYVGVNGQWRMAQPYVGVDGTWKLQDPA